MGGAPATLVCLAVILLVLTGVAVASALVTRSSAVAADRSRVLVVDYAEARFAVSQEESLERKHRAEPGPSVRSLHLVAVHRLDTAMRQVALHAGGAKRRVARDITGRNAAYVASVHALFDATDAHDAALALKIDHSRSTRSPPLCRTRCTAGHSCTTRPPRRPVVTCDGSRRSR